MSVVERASDPESPLHRAFEWDDVKAAGLYRLRQAQSLIRAVITIRDGRTPEHRTFTLVVRDDEDSTYESSMMVAADEDAFEAAVGRLRAVLASAQASVDDLVTLASVMRRSAATRRRVQSVKRSLDRAGKGVKMV